MSKIRSVKFNFIMNVILTASTFIFPLITFPYIARVLLPAGTGKVNFAMSVASYFTMIAMLGVPTYGVRACAQVRDDKEKLSRVTHEILFINIMVSVLVYVMYFAAVLNVPRLRSDASLFYVMSFTILFNVIGVEWMYRGLEQYSYITIRSIAFKILGIILMFILVKDQSDYVIYGAISIVAGVGSNLFNFINLRKFIYLRPVGNYKLKKHFKVIAVFFFMSIATTIYTNLDTVMLGFMKNDMEIGYYGSAVKVKNILVSLVTALSTVLLPRVSYYLERGMKEEFFAISKKAFTFVFLIASPVTVYFILYALESTLLLSGDAFLGSVLPMQVIMPTVLLIGITNVLGIQMLVPQGRETAVFYSVAAGALVDLVINAVFIPKMASTGAAVGTLIAEMVVLVVQIIALKDSVLGILREVQYGKILAGIVLGGAACLWVKMLDISNFGRLAISSILYFGVYLAVLIIWKEPTLSEVLEGIIKKVHRRK